MKFDIDLKATIHFYQYVNGDNGLDCKLEKLTDAVNTLSGKTDKIMATIDELVEKMDGLTTTVDGIQALIAGLKQQVADALSGVTLPPAVQAKLDDVFAKAESNKQELDDALLSNTPSEPPV